MNSLVKVISTRIGSSNRRLVKFLRFGKSDVQEKFEASPYGFDSVPVKNTIAIYLPTNEVGNEIIVGYINKNKVANIGENRLFSTDENGTEKTYIYLKNDGVIELGGNSDNAVRYSKLKKGFDELKNDLIELQNKWNAFASAYVPGSPTTVGLPPTLATQTVVNSTASIDSSKIDNVKTN